MATAYVVPKKFDTEYFFTWIQHLKCCATANGWSAAEKLNKLPTLTDLRDPAAAYNITLVDDRISTFADSFENLTSPKEEKSNEMSQQNQMINSIFSQFV